MLQSRTIESVKFLDKILFYDIHIENVEYNLFDRTIITNKWLRFEDWQQIYEKLKSSLSVCTLADLSEFPENSFLISNNIQVEISVIPTKCFYDEIFALDAHCCAPNLLQILIRQLNAIELKARIVELERSSANKSRKKQSKLNEKGKKTAEYNPTISMRNLRGEYVPQPNVKPYTPYKATKFTNDRPDSKDLEEPYSPKPVTATNSDDIPIELDSSMEKYSPIVPSNSDSTSNEIPKYKPSTIVISESSDQSSPRLRSNRVKASSNKLSITKKSKNVPIDENEDTKNIAMEPIKEMGEDDDDIENNAENDSNELQSTAETLVPLHQKRKRKSPQLSSVELEKHRLSQDLFEESDSKSDDSYRPTGRKRTKPSHSTKNSMNKSSPSSSSKSKKTGDDSKKATTDNIRSRSSSKRSPTRASKFIDHNNKVKNDGDSEKQGKRKKDKTASRSKSKTPDTVPNSIVIPHFAKPTEEELRKEREQQAKNIEQLETLGKQLKELNKPTPNVEIIHLNNISVEDLLGTFDEVKPMLDKHFNKHKSQTRYQTKSENDKLYLFIAKIINRDNLMPMVEHLQSVYEPDSDGVPSYTDLFTNLMLPEWVLFIFMKEYNLNRHDAIERIKIQEFEEGDCNDTLP